jgi:hypothetical protein
VAYCAPLAGARLTKTPPRVKLSRLSPEVYVDFLEQAGARDFAFLRFRDFLPGAGPLPDRYIALRHDVDFAPAYSLEMAELEHAAGVVATYHVLVDGQFYNPLDPAVVRQIRRIHELGHEVGLHVALATADQTGAEVAFRRDLLSDIVGAPVRSFSQHDPVNAGLAAVELPPDCEPCVDAYDVMRDHDLLYVSDSAMMWRRYTFATALDEGRNLCLLAHPHSWLHPQNDYVALIREFEAGEVRRVTDRFDAFVNALSGYYRRRLDEGA